MSDNPQAKYSSGRTVSTTVSALLLFCAINAWFVLAHPKLSDPAETAERGWSYWSLKAMHQADPSTTNVVLLGSSLVSAALFECDATFMAKAPLDLCFYRDSQYFDHQLRCQFGPGYKTLSLAAPGQIPSDAYLTIKVALLNGITPSVVIYGLAPRDFIDHTLKDACDTESFHYFSHLVDLQECATDLFKDPMAQLNRTLGRCVYLYNAAPQITLAANAAGWQALHYLLSHGPGEAPGSMMQRRASHRLLPQYQPFDMEPGKALATSLHARGPYLDNIQDYKDRYRQPNIAAYHTQMRFLQRLIALCQSNDIDIILVNMPITKQNMDLLDSQWRQRYFTDLTRMCALHNVEWFDQCQFDQYRQDDFRDSVHLNGFGGKKFVDRLVSHMAARREALGAILPTGSHEKRSMASSRTTNFSPGIQ